MTRINGCRSSTKERAMHKKYGVLFCFFCLIVFFAVSALAAFPNVRIKGTNCDKESPTISFDQLMGDDPVYECTHRTDDNKDKYFYIDVEIIPNSLPKPCKNCATTDIEGTMCLPEHIADRQASEFADEEADYKYCQRDGRRQWCVLEGCKTWPTDPTVAAGGDQYVWLKDKQGRTVDLIYLFFDEIKEDLYPRSEFASEQEYQARMEENETEPVTDDKGNTTEVIKSLGIRNAFLDAMNKSETIRLYFNATTSPLSATDQALPVRYGRTSTTRVPLSLIQQPGAAGLETTEALYLELRDEGEKFCVYVSYAPKEASVSQREWYVTREVAQSWDDVMGEKAYRYLHEENETDEHCIDRLQPQKRLQIINAAEHFIDQVCLDYNNPLYNRAQYYLTSPGKSGDRVYLGAGSVIVQCIERTMAKLMGWGGPAGVEGYGEDTVAFIEKQLKETNESLSAGTNSVQSKIKDLDTDIKTANTGLKAANTAHGALVKKVWEDYVKVIQDDILAVRAGLVAQFASDPDFYRRFRYSEAYDLVFNEELSVAATIARLNEQGDIVLGNPDLFSGKIKTLEKAFVAIPDKADAADLTTSQAATETIKIEKTDGTTVTLVVSVSSNNNKLSASITAGHTITEQEAEIAFTNDSPLGQVNKITYERPGCVAPAAEPNKCTLQPSIVAGVPESFPTKLGTITISADGNYYYQVSTAQALDYAGIKEQVEAPIVSHMKSWLNDNMSAKTHNILTKLKDLQTLVSTKQPDLRSYYSTVKGLNEELAELGENKDALLIEKARLERKKDNAERLLKIYKDDAGEALKGGIFGRVQKNLRIIVQAFLIIYVIFIGYRLMIGKSLFKQNELLWVAIKISLVTYFAAGPGIVQWLPEGIKASKYTANLLFHMGGAPQTLGQLQTDLSNLKTSTQSSVERKESLDQVVNNINKHNRAIQSDLIALREELVSIMEKANLPGKPDAYTDPVTNVTISPEYTTYYNKVIMDAAFAEVSRGLTLHELNKIGDLNNTNKITKLEEIKLKTKQDLVDYVQLVRGGGAVPSDTSSMAVFGQMADFMQDRQKVKAALKSIVQRQFVTLRTEEETDEFLDRLWDSHLKNQSAKSSPSGTGAVTGNLYLIPMQYHAPGNMQVATLTQSIVDHIEDASGNGILGEMRTLDALIEKDEDDAVLTNSTNGYSWSSPFYNFNGRTELTIRDYINLSKKEDEVIQAQIRDLKHRLTLEGEKTGLMRFYNICNFDDKDYLGYEALKMWDIADCKINQYLGVGYDQGGNPRVPIIFKLVGTVLMSFWSTGYSIPIFFFGAIFGAFIALLFLRAVHISVMAFIGVIFLAFMSPLIIPTVLFAKTKSMFDAWLKQLIAFLLQPTMIMLLLVLLFFVMDDFIFGDTMNDPTNFDSATYTIKDCSADPEEMICNYKDSEFWRQGNIISDLFGSDWKFFRVTLPNDEKDVFIGFLKLWIICFFLYSISGSLIALTGRLAGSIGEGGAAAMGGFPNVSPTQIASAMTSTAAKGAGAALGARKAKRAISEKLGGKKDQDKAKGLDDEDEDKDEDEGEDKSEEGGDKDKPEK